MQDKAFYDYLNNMPDEEFDQWLEQATDEQLDLADKLFDEAKLNKQDTTEDLSLAQNFLKQFTLGG